MCWNSTCDCHWFPYGKKEKEMNSCCVKEEGKYCNECGQELPPTDIEGLSRKELEDAYVVLDKLYEECVKTLKLIPPCPDHGALCQSYYREWLTFFASTEIVDAKVRQLRAEIKRQDKKIETARSALE